MPYDIPVVNEFTSHIYFQNHNYVSLNQNMNVLLSMLCAHALILSI